MLETALIFCNHIIHASLHKFGGLFLALEKGVPVVPFDSWYSQVEFKNFSFQVCENYTGCIEASVG